MNSLATVRLSLSADADDTGVDAAALLEWTHSTSAVSSFRKLRDEERNGIVRWLKDSVGPVAEVIFTMVSQDLADAVPVGACGRGPVRGSDPTSAGRADRTRKGRGTVLRRPSAYGEGPHRIR